MQTQAQQNGPQAETYDFVIIGSGFGGSVSAMRLTEKGYRVLVLERGKRWRDADFARSNWNIWKWLWLPVLRCFGILQISLFKGVLILHGSGVGGGSLGYANVLMEPDDSLFEAPTWRHLGDWKAILRPHYETARRMLGVTTNPRLWPADKALRDIAQEMGRGDTFRPTEVGVFFDERGEEGETVPDPYFGGEGPLRAGCIHCGACMVGCRYNAKNTLMKNYLYFAEKWGARVTAQAQATDIRPLPAGQPDGARYEVRYRRSTNWPNKNARRVRARNVVLSAGVLGTLELLFTCRDVTGSLSDLSPRLGEVVRTNSEEFLGVTGRDRQIHYSDGLAITSVFQADEVTYVEPVRYPDGSSLMRMLGAPIVETGGGVFVRLLKVLKEIVVHPVEFFDARLFARWARRSTILMIMQTQDNLMRLRLGRSLLTFFRRRLVSERDTERPVPARLDVGHQVARRFGAKTDGAPLGTINESVFNIPLTAHIMGGCSFGRGPEEGVVDLKCEVFNYPGLYVVDGSIIPANPGINPSLTITALAEYAMSHIPANDGNARAAQPLGVPVPQTLTPDTTS